MRLRRTLSVALIAALAVVASPPPSIRAQNRPTMLRASGGGTELRSWDVTIDRLSRDGSLRRRRLDADPTMPGREHERLDQYYKGVRVLGGDIVRQTDRGSVVSVFGTIYEGLELDVEPALSAAEANAIATRDSGIELGPRRVPELLVWPEDGGARLVYQTKVFSPGGGTEYLIDATDGTIVRRLDAVQRQSAVGTGTGVLADIKKISVSRESGTYFTDDLLRPPYLVTYNMGGNLNRVLNFLNGFISLSALDRGSDTDNTWTDGAVVDAHTYTGYVYDYYFKRFGRRGLDNNNLELTSLVHPVSRSNYCNASREFFGDFCVNASYWGDGIMVYGEGVASGLLYGGQSWNYLAAALDVVGHELTHGVTDYSSNLMPVNESGALNESFSDMMGTAIEFFYQRAGSGLMSADYLIGEDAVTPGGIRSLANPAAYGDPDHYSRRAITTEDNGGVHTNSGIGDQAYFLAIEGGVNRTSGLAVQGVGQARRDLIERTMYRAFTQLMTSNTNYSGARAATIQAARDLFGSNSPAEIAVTQAWTAVGVN